MGMDKRMDNFHRNGHIIRHKDKDIVVDMFFKLFHYHGLKDPEFIAVNKYGIKVLPSGNFGDQNGPLLPDVERLIKYSDLGILFFTAKIEWESDHQIDVLYSAEGNFSVVSFPYSGKLSEKEVLLKNMFIEKYQ